MSLSKGNKLKNDRYTIDKELGDGSYGITYKAIDNFSKTTVVIKTLKNKKTHQYYKDHLERFQREANVLKKLSGHPNIVPIYDFFSQENERFYLVMEFLSEETLSHLVDDKGKLPERLALDYIRQIGSALKALHNENWVHRDVHPGNIMIVENKAVLIDFGIVGNPQFKTDFHPTNYHFAPYEQKRRASREPTVDIYALAACLYYALTTECPAASVDRIDRHERLIPPRKHNSSISQEVENAILQGMELEAENRPQSIEEWLNLLPTTSSRNDPLSSNHASGYIEPNSVQSPRTNDDLSTGKIDYTRLRNLLAAKKWKEADKETLAVMLKATGTANKNRLKKSIKDLPQTDLHTIDTLWVRYSNGRFGFSVQKRIWKSVDCDYKKFRAQVGWKTFVISKTQEKDADGHFPVQFAQKYMWIPNVGKDWVKKGICLCGFIYIYNTQPDKRVFLLWVVLWVGFILYFEVREYNKSIVEYLLTRRMPD
jgi:serine/threonine-protein kinase